MDAVLEGICGGLEKAANWDGDANCGAKLMGVAAVTRPNAKEFGFESKPGVCHAAAICSDEGNWGGNGSGGGLAPPP
jgi:hypothetical protein